MTEKETNSLLVEQRKGKIGGTDVSAIVGMNPYKSAFSVWLEKTGRASDIIEDNDAMARGRRMEPVLASLYAATHPEIEVAMNRNRTQDIEYIEDKEYSFLIAHPDRLIFKENKIDSGLEIKTANIMNRQEWGEPGTDEVPAHYLIQCQWYMGLMQVQNWNLIVGFFNDDNKLISNAEYCIINNSELFQKLRQEAIAFYTKNIIGGVEPVIDAADNMVTQWIKERYPNNNGILESATLEEETLMDRLLKAKEAAEESQKRYEVLQEEIKLAIGERDGIISGTYGKVTWKKTKDSVRTDYKALIDEIQPEQSVIDKYTTVKPGYRRLDTRSLKLNK